MRIAQKGGGKEKMEESSNKGYGKRPLWQWIALYIVVGGIIYGLVYYFVFANKGYSGNPSGSGAQQSQPKSY